MPAATVAAAAVGTGLFVLLLSWRMPTRELLLITLLAAGHALLEGVPGLGKTLLARTLAAHKGGRFKRVQCTSDLMPADITGVHVFNSDNRTFEFIPGPLFADVVLVDEINRTSPKTQSALLEAMEANIAAYRVDDFYYLSRSCLVKDERNLDKFDRVFGHVFKGGD